MGRQKIPTNILEMRGSYSNHPERKKDRENEFKPESLGEAPDHLNADHKQIWHEIVSSVPPATIGRSDRIALETLSKLVFIMRFDFENMTGGELGRLETMLARFGLTPSDRSKVIVKPATTPENDPWANI